MYLNIAFTHCHTKLEGSTAAPCQVKDARLITTDTLYRATTHIQSTVTL